MNFKFTNTFIIASLLAAAQPMQAASYTNHAKKAVRCAWHANKIIGGSTMLATSCIMAHYSWRLPANLPQEWPMEIEVSDITLTFTPRVSHKSVRTALLITSAQVFIAALAALKSGYDGLKAEWLKN